MNDVLNDVKHNIVFLGSQLALSLGEILSFSVELAVTVYCLDWLSSLDLLNPPISLFFCDLSGVDFSIHNIHDAVLVNIVVSDCFVICQNHASVNQKQIVFVKFSNGIFFLLV